MVQKQYSTDDTLFEGPDFFCRRKFSDLCCACRNSLQQITDRHARLTISKATFVEYFMQDCLLPYNEAQDKLGEIYDRIFRDGQIVVSTIVRVEGKPTTVHAEVKPLY